MKKIIALAIIFFLFYQTVNFFNDKMDQTFFDDYYAELDEAREDDEDPSLWNKVTIFFDELFEDKKERFIYK